MADGSRVTTYTSGKDVRSPFKGCYWTNAWSKTEKFRVEVRSLAELLDECEGSYQLLSEHH
jgi:hypothetical protein